MLVRLLLLASLVAEALAFRSTAGARATDWTDGRPTGPSSAAGDLEAQEGLPPAAPRSEAEKLPVGEDIHEKMSITRIAAEPGRRAIVAAAQRWLSMPSEPLPVPKDAVVALVDTAVLRRQAERWNRLLPRVEPFYAVKCNPHPLVVQTLRRVWHETGWGGFDCASPAEIDLVRSEDAEAVDDRMIFANPCKMESAITHAREVGLRRLVFDNSAELDKIASLHPGAELVLRVQTDDKLTQCPLSNKFGADPSDCPELFAKAKELGLQVVGVSFHVGSGCSEREAFPGALRRARDVFDEGGRQGFNMTLLDIGGGFLGWDEVGRATFAEHAADINASLQMLFPSPSVRVIAEPGRFLVASAQSMLTTVIAVAATSRGDRYYLNDGLYGSFNCLVFDHASVPAPIILRDGEELSEEHAADRSPCTLFGPTCDGFDIISESLHLPRLRVGDRLVFPNMGAYTTAACTRFNGFGQPTFFPYESQLPRA